MSNAGPDKAGHTASALRARVQRAGLRLTRKRGQCFLIDDCALDLIVSAADLCASDHVLEIGSGPGNLTAALAESGAQILACEIDPGLAAVAAEVLDDKPNVRCLVCDALDGHGHISRPLADELARFVQLDSRLKVVSNLPYCISTPAITAFVESQLPWDRLVLTVQKEVAERLIASSRTKAYSYLSARVQLQCDVEVLGTLSPRAFWPRPEVSSAVVRIVPKGAGQAIADADLRGFKRLATAIFRSRRKTLLNSLNGSLTIPLDREAIARKLQMCGFDPGSRGERLTPEQMLEMAQCLGLMDAPPSAGPDDADARP